MSENMSPNVDLNNISKSYYEAPTINMLISCQVNIVDYFLITQK